MKKNFEKDSTERNMFADLYNLCQKYWIAEDTDEYWTALIDDIDKLVNKYKCKMLTKWMVEFIVQKEQEINGEVNK